MKIGNIQNIVRDISKKWKAFTLPSKQYEESVSFEHEIKSLPMKHLEEWFQKRFNKNLDYDQWVGVRDALDQMGWSLYEKALSIMGDSVLVIQKENQIKIEEQERVIKEKNDAISKLESELKKYID